MRRAVSARVVLAAVLALLVLGGSVLSGVRLGGLANGTQTVLRWAQSMRAVGWTGFAVLQVFIVASGVLPASVAGMAAGAVYGVVLGFGLAATSTLAGALLTLAISRSLARNWIEHFMRRRPRLQNLDRMLAADGIRMVCLLRLSPVMPFAATSYALGLSSVSVRDYVLGTCASLPALFGYVVLGYLAAAGLTTGDAGWLRWSMLAVAALATIALTMRSGQLLLRARIVPSSLRDAAGLLSRGSAATTDTEAGPSAQKDVPPGR
jgi:uncharacterized membrane protein YdjX (TVP38/TMEM64 family)